MTRAPANPFTAFCRKAFDFLEGSGVRHLVIGGLAVGAIGEAGGLLLIIRSAAWEAQ
jgi:hypothetical protein